MTQQWCCIDNEYADKYVVMLGLQEYETGGCQTHPHECSVEKADTDFVVVVLADVVYGSDAGH